MGVCFNELTRRLPKEGGFEAEKRLTHHVMRWVVEGHVDQGQEQALVHRRVARPLRDRSPEKKPRQEQDELPGMKDETTDLVLNSFRGLGIVGRAVGRPEELQVERASNLERGL